VLDVSDRYSGQAKQDGRTVGTCGSLCSRLRITESIEGPRVSTRDPRAHKIVSFPPPTSKSRQRRPRLTPVNRDTLRPSDGVASFQRHLRAAGDCVGGVVNAPRARVQRRFSYQILRVPIR